MNFYEIILIGVALSMDACALTIANCTTYKKVLSAKKEWAMPITFALFQGLMPLLGFLIGSAFFQTLSSVADFLTAGIFLGLSVKIIFDIVKNTKKEKIICGKDKCEVLPKFTFYVLIIQAFATSIDALFVGVTLVNLSFSVFIAVSIIAAVTFALVSLALIFGKKLGQLLDKYAEWMGAIILFALAIKSLIEGIIKR